MPQAKQISHHLIPQTNLKWQTYDSPASTDLMYQDGANLLITPRGYTERRPGFSIALEPTPTTFTGTIKRIYEWQRWDTGSSGATAGKFIWMVCEVTATNSNVYKLELGTDASFSLIFSSASLEPFDFTSSNNFVLFGNGTDMMKYDATTVTRWGIVAPAVAPITASGTAVPTDFTSRPSTYTQPQHYNFFRNPQAVWDGTTSTICEIQVKNQSVGTSSVVTWQGFSKVSGTVTALTLKTNSYVNIGTDSTPYATVTLSYSTDGGVTWTQIYQRSGIGVWPTNTDVTAIDPASDLSQLVVKAELYDTHDHAAYLSVGGIWVDASTTSDMSATHGWQHCYTYCNASTGHESSPSPVSLSTGVVNTKQLSVTVVASEDPQVDQIRVYRTPDGGDPNPDEMQEITGSPFPNVSAVIDDATKDVDLGLRYAPAAYRNDPPPPSKGVVRSESSGRIFTFDGSTLFYSGQEEITFGVPEECFPGELDGNYRTFASDVTGVGDATDGPLIMCCNRITQLLGDTRDTFRWKKVADRQGTRQRRAVDSFGGGVTWRDTAGSMYKSDGVEFGFPIRDQIDSIDWTNCQVATHISGLRRWICLLDATNSVLYVYDIDQDQWMVPWTVAATAIYSGEVTAGSFKLAAAVGGTVYLLTNGTYTDGDSAYAAWGKLNLFPVTNENHPDAVGVIDYIGIETGVTLPTTVKVLTDDATTAAAGEWVDITANKVEPDKRKQGTVLLESYYKCMSDEVAARRCAIWLDWGTSATNFYWYTLDVAYHSTTL